jgi:hypothetical protein
MKNQRIGNVFAAIICAAAVFFAAILAGTPMGVAEHVGLSDDLNWEVVATNGGDCSYDSLRARVERLEEIVADWKRGARESKPQPEPWQESTVIQLTNEPQPYTQTTVVCTGGTCRQQPQQARTTGPLRRIFRR